MIKMTQNVTRENETQDTILGHKKKKEIHKIETNQHTLRKVVITAKAKKEQADKEIYNNLAFLKGPQPAKLC